MKKSIILIQLIFIFVHAYSQFEHKMSVNLAFGGFKTFGYATGDDDYTPLQMPHYRPGIMTDAGLQLNINRRFSVTVYAGILHSWKWSYIPEDSEEDWFYYVLPDTGIPITDGYNELKLFNFSIGITPKIYLSPGSKWNPYIFAGLNFNFTSAYYANNWWYDSKELGLLSPDDTEPYNPFLENNTGIGFMPGFGIEYSPGEKYCLVLNTGYSFIKLQEENFEDPDVAGENFNAFFLQAGIRFNFLKSKEL